MDYHVKPPGKTCTATGKPLEPGSVCYSVLLGKEGEFVRQDYAESAWEGPPENAVGYWRRRIPEAERAGRPQLSADELFLSFEQLSEDLNKAQEKFRYVLALLLLKKRRLKLEDSRQEEEGDWLIVSGSRGEGPYEVRDLHLPQDQLNQLEAALHQQVAAGWTEEDSAAEENAEAEHETAVEPGAEPAPETPAEPETAEADTLQFAEDTDPDESQHEAEEAA
ncbi:MAG: hypothetical protein KDA79_23320 [Planctomycetaceae bacterium]|nr:hypothetical protein [Planctomycetaceae bacterium]